jgi:hypothetical protein
MRRRGVVIFPDHFLSSQEWQPRTEKYPPKIIVGFDEHRVGDSIRQEIIRMLKEKREKSKIPSPKGERRFKIIQLDFDGRNCCVVLQGEEFLVFDPPIESRSKTRGSRALYYAAHEKLGLLLQWLPPYCPTSSHDHERERWVEKNFLLAGKADLQTSQGTYSLTAAHPVGPTIAPNVVHKTVAGNQPSLIVIRIEGDRDWFRKWLTGRGHDFKPLPTVP